MAARIQLSGPFFQARDPSQTVRDNIRDWLADIAAELEQEVTARMEAGEGHRRPVRKLGDDARVSQYVRGRVSSLGGKPWHQWAVVSPDSSGLNRERAISLMAAASEIETVEGPFKAATRGERRAIRDLTKGLE